MKRTLVEYEEVIRKLPRKNKYTKEDLLINEFLLDKKGSIEIYYAPHNEYVNSDPKVFIIGITPGFQQMSTAIKVAKDELDKNTSISEIQYKCKESGRFSGVIRKNIINMLDDIELNKVLGMESCSSLFNEDDHLLHTVSLIPYPVFVNGKNYSGHSPKLISNQFLMNWVRVSFIEEIRELKNFNNILIVPLGKAVEEILFQFQKENIIGDNQILKGFPHPSGANGGRLKQLEENRGSMMKFLKEFNRCII